MILYSIVHSILVDSSNNSTWRELLGVLIIFVFMAYVVGALPALLTGLLTDLISKISGDYFKNTSLRVVTAALLGFLLTISVLVLFLFYTKEMDELYKTDPTSVIACSIYGAIAAAACEYLYFKLGSPDSIE